MLKCAGCSCNATCLALTAASAAPLVLATGFIMEGLEGLEGLAVAGVRGVGGATTATTAAPEHPVHPQPPAAAPCSAPHALSLVQLALEWVRGQCNSCNTGWWLYHRLGSQVDSRGLLSAADSAVAYAVVAMSSSDGLFCCCSARLVPSCLTCHGPVQP